MFLKEDDTLKEVIDYYGFIKGELGVILINDELVTLYDSHEIKLKDGDTIKFYPIFGGG